MISYRTFEKVYKELILVVKSLTSEWSNFDDKDIGNAILKLIAIYDSVVDYYFEYYLDNTYLPAIEDKATDWINDMLGNTKFEYKGQSITLRIDWKGCGPDDYVIIPKYTKLNVYVDGAAFEFLTIKDYLYRQGVSKMLISVTQGEYLNLRLSKTDIQDRRIFITDQNLDIDTLDVTVDDYLWTFTRSVDYEREEACSYSIVLDDGDTYLILPDDYDTLFPSDLSILEITGVLIGSQFDYSQFCISAEFASAIFDLNGNDVSSEFEVYPTNEASMDAFNGSKLELLKDKCITLFDFERLSQGYPGILDSAAFNWGDSDYYLQINEPHFVKLAVVADTGFVTESTKNLLYSYLSNMSRVREGSLVLKIIDPKVIRTDLFITIDLGTWKDTAYEPEIYQNIQSITESYFELPNMLIGQKFSKSDLENRIVKGEPRVKYVDAQGTVLEPYTKAQLLVLGKLTIATDVTAGIYFDYGEATDKVEIEVVSTDSGELLDETVTRFEISTSDEGASEEILIANEKELYSSEDLGGGDTLKIDLEVTENESSVEESSSFEVQVGSELGILNESASSGMGSEPTPDETEEP